MYLTEEQLKAIGLKEYGTNVLISDKCSIYNAQNITIGNDVRIDDFVILSAGTDITIANNVHIGCYSSLIGKGKIYIGRKVAISGRVSIYSSTDDYYSGEHGFGFVNNTVEHGDVFIFNNAVVGCGSVVLPNSVIENDTSVGALSLVNGALEEGSIYAGIPCKRIGSRHEKRA